MKEKTVKQVGETIDKIKDWIKKWIADFKNETRTT